MKGDAGFYADRRGQTKQVAAAASIREERDRTFMAIRRLPHRGQLLRMSGIYTREEQHKFSAATNRKGGAPCARRIGLILELLSLIAVCVKVTLNRLTQLSFKPILAKAFGMASTKRAKEERQFKLYG
jgi:hypothetical protein